MKNPLKSFMELMKDQMHSKVHKYTTSIEYWERIEHVRPIRTHDDEWGSKRYY
jgi:hypothetical protein